MADVRVAQQVGPLAGVTDVGLILSDDDVDGRARLQAEDAFHGPSAKQQLARLAPIAAKAAAFSEGQVVYPGRLEDMPQVDRGAAPVQAAVELVLGDLLGERRLVGKRLAPGVVHQISKSVTEAL